MINDVIIIDDIVSDSYQNMIENELLGEIMASWYLLDDISYSQDTNKLSIKENNRGLVHPLKVNNAIKSHLYNLILPVVLTSIDQINFQLNEVLAGRCFLQFPSSNNSPNNPHVDLPFSHLVCLYYVNNTDGDTIIYNETSNQILEDNVKSTEFSIYKRVSPKKGRVILFNGEHYHSSSKPTIDRRCIINFNLI